VDAAIEDGDSLYCCFCLDSLVDHIAAKVFALEMDEELLIVVSELAKDNIIISTCSIENTNLPINSCTKDTILLLFYFFMQVILLNCNVTFSICL
jgi:hypothetical protein